eukprot:TRINITY_DN3790_c0_g1_i1.p2 TRINITY_DN3790_c0_g1~~TRINITY_DN3790_c0_g1_i1.p2  ORF type:complete len:146 (+),score=71.41 TRINITY_DN3790_c0_g1_i1:42-440(+)
MATVGLTEGVPVEKIKELQRAFMIEQKHLIAIAPILKHSCKEQNVSFLECKAQDVAPSACISSGMAAVNCALKTFKFAKEVAPQELEEYATCLEYNGFRPDLCRTSEKAFYTKVKGWLAANDKKTEDISSLQ